MYQYRDFYDENFTRIFEGEKYNVVVENVGDDDVNKRWVSVHQPDGSEIHVDWCPYESFTPDDFDLWMSLNKPDRHSLKQFGPLGYKDLRELCELMNKN